MKRWIWATVTLFLFFGVAVTLIDYRNWRQLETSKYGQGIGDLQAPALVLTRMYQNKDMGFRLRLPGNWKIKENLTPTQSINIEDRISIGITSSAKNLTDFVGDEVDRLKKAGKTPLYDREYVNTDKINLTVLTWEEDLPGGVAQIRQEAMAKRGDRVLIINLTVPSENWGDLQKTMLEIYKSVELI